MALNLTTNPGRQKQVVTNIARNLVFFEDQSLCFNYMTKQWTRLPAYAGYGMYSINDEDADIGLVINSAGVTPADLQKQLKSYPAQTGTITTGATDVMQGQRGVVLGVRPLADGGTNTVRVGVQDSIGDSVTWSTVTSVNSRTGMANFRSEGRYHRVEVTLNDHETCWGADVDFTPAGRV